MALTLTPKSVHYPELSEKAEISAGEECLARAIELIEGIGLPGGLLPLKDITEGGYVEETGFVWVVMKNAVKHHFKKAGKQCYYGEKITCYLEKGKMRDIKGVQVKEFLWLNLTDISVDEKSPDHIYFRVTGGLGRSLPAEHFGRDC